MRTLACVGVMMGVLATGCQVEILADSPGAPTPERVERPARPVDPLPSPVGSAVDLVVVPVASPLPTPLAPRNPSLVTGWVLGPDAQPMAGVLVRGHDVSLAQGALRIKTQTRTNPDGSFALSAADGQPLNLEAIASDDLKAFTFRITPGTGDVRLGLGPTGSLIGRVVAPDGATDLEGTDVSLSGTPYTAKTDAAGRFTVEDVPPGDYDMRAWHPAHGEAQAPNVRVGPQETTHVQDLTLGVLAAGGR